MDKIYVILYNAHEFDDLDVGDLTPIYCSLSSQNRDLEYKRIFENAQQDFEEFRKEDDFFENDIINKTFRYSIGNWCYEYAITEYPLDKNFRYNNG